MPYPGAALWRGGGSYGYQPSRIQELGSREAHRSLARETIAGGFPAGTRHAPVIRDFPRMLCGWRLLRSWAESCADAFTVP